MAKDNPKGRKHGANNVWGWSQSRQYTVHTKAYTTMETLRLGLVTKQAIYSTHEGVHYDGNTPTRIRPRRKDNNNNNSIQRRYSRFFTISSQRRELSPTRTLKWPGRNTCANHVQHIERLSRANVMLRATWYEGTAQLLSLTEVKSHLFELYFIS